MSVDIEKVSKLVGLVDKLIQIKGIENSLDESAVMNLIRSGLDIRFLRCQAKVSLLIMIRKIGMMMPRPILRLCFGPGIKTI